MFILIVQIAGLLRHNVKTYREKTKDDDGAEWEEEANWPNGHHKRKLF